MSYLPLRAHPTTLPLLLAASLDLFVTVLVPVEAEKAEAAVEAVETIEAVATCEACPETFRDLITQQKKRQKITFNEESRKVGGHSTTTWTIFYPILTPSLLEWTNMAILHTSYPLSVDPLVDFLLKLTPSPLFLST